MKINTKKTKVLRVSKGSESDNEDSSCSGNYGTSQGILLLRKHDIRLCHREIKRKIATAASIWFEIWGVVDPGKKNFDFYRQISQKFQSFQAILQKNIEFCRQISENFDSFRQLKNSIFQAQNCPFTATSGQIILFLFKINHFRTYFLYMIRYNNISRPASTTPTPPLRSSLRLLCPKSGGRDSQPTGLTPLDSNWKEAFSRRKELPRGGLRRMKMPQEKNGENTDLKCDLVYCAEIRTKRKEDITRLEAFEMKVWRRMKKISWTEHISNEVLKLVEEERSLLTIIRTRQRNWMGHTMTGDSL